MADESPIQPEIATDSIKWEAQKQYDRSGLLSKVSPSAAGCVRSGSAYLYLRRRRRKRSRL